MRVVVSGLLIAALVSCAGPPPAGEASVPPPPPGPAMAGAPVPLAPPAPAVAPPPPGPQLAAVPESAALVPAFFGALVSPFSSRAPGPTRLTLSNFSYDAARVQTLVTGYPDCELREGTATADFVLPLNGTRIIQAPPGADVCWRRAVAPGTAPGAGMAGSGWTPWNRAYLSAGRAIDSRL